MHSIVSMNENMLKIGAAIAFSRRLRLSLERMVINRCSCCVCTCVFLEGKQRDKTTDTTRHETNVKRRYVSIDRSFLTEPKRNRANDSTDLRDSHCVDIVRIRRGILSRLFESNINPRRRSERKRRQTRTVPVSWFQILRSRTVATNRDFNFHRINTQIRLISKENGCSEIVSIKSKNPLAFCSS